MHTQDRKTLQHSHFLLLLLQRNARVFSGGENCAVASTRVTASQGHSGMQHHARVLHVVGVRLAAGVVGNPAQVIRRAWHAGTQTVHKLPSDGNHAIAGTRDDDCILLLTYLHCTTSRNVRRCSN